MSSQRARRPAEAAELDLGPRHRSTVRVRQLIVDPRAAGPAPANATGGRVSQGGAQGNDEGEGAHEVPPGLPAVPRQGAGSEPRMGRPGLDEEAAVGGTDAVRARRPGARELEGAGGLQRTDPGLDPLRHAGRDHDRRVEMEVRAQLRMGDPAGDQHERRAQGAGRQDHGPGAHPERASRDAVRVAQRAAHAGRPARLALALDPLDQRPVQDPRSRRVRPGQVDAQSRPLGAGAAAKPAAATRGARPGVPLGGSALPAQGRRPIENHLVLGRNGGRRLDTQLLAEARQVGIGLRPRRCPPSRTRPTRRAATAAGRCRSSS